MAVAFVSGHTRTANTTTANGTFTLDWSASFTPSNGNALVVVLSVGGSTHGVTAAPSGWTFVNGNTAGVLGAAILYKENCSTSDTSVTLTGTSASTGIYTVREYSGGKVSGLVDANGKAEDETNVTTASTSCATGTTGTRSQANGLGIAIMICDDGANIEDADGGSWSGSWSNVVYANRTTSSGHRIAELAITSTAGTSATYSGFTSDQNYGAILILDEAGGGATTLTAASGSFTLTGNATGLAVARKMTASAASFSLTGSAATLTYTSNKTLTADVGSFTLTGITVGLKVDRVLATSTGSYSFTGNAVNLTYATAGTITAGTGTFSLTGITTGFTVARKLTATTESFALTGNAAGLAIGRVLSAVTGAYTLAGVDTTLTAAIAKRLTCDTGSFVVSGKAIDLVLDTGRQGDGTITKQEIAGKKIAKVKSKEQLKLERIFGREEEPSELVARLLEPVVNIPADIKQEVKGKDSVSKAKVIVAYAEVYKETLKAVERKKVDQILMAYEESMQKRMILRRQEEELLLLMTF